MYNKWHHKELGHLSPTTELPNSWPVWLLCPGGRVLLHRLVAIFRKKIGKKTFQIYVFNSNLFFEFSKQYTPWINLLFVVNACLYKNIIFCIQTHFRKTYRTLKGIKEVILPTHSNLFVIASLFIPNGNLFFGRKMCNAHYDFFQMHLYR